MKRITKIQSVSDIITNSSFEVFVMSAEDANYYDELDTNGCVSIERIEEGVFEYLKQKIKELNIQNVAFGAHFVKFLRNSSIKTWLYEPESFSKNVILAKDEVRITPSSFNLSPIKIIEL